MKDFKALAKEIREQVQKTICVGPVSGIDERMKALLDEFEDAIMVLADDEACRRVVIYLNEMKAEIPDETED